VAALASAAALAAEAHGRGARVWFQPGQGDLASRLVAVPDALAAAGAWQAAGLRGRRLVVLSGQWSRPRNPRREPATAEEIAAGRVTADGLVLEARSALYWAARSGLVRAIDVVMPPETLERRLAEVRGRKELRLEGGAFRLPVEGLERRFSTPAGFTPAGEEVLVLVEPSWFGAGAPPDPLGWLRDRGARWDLALVALADPAATAEQRRLAQEYGVAAAARFGEAGP